MWQCPAYFLSETEQRDILVKLLLNEREVTLPLRTDVSPYYHWNDVREYWKKVVKGISLPESKDK